MDENTTNEKHGKKFNYIVYFIAFFIFRWALIAGWNSCSTLASTSNRSTTHRTYEEDSSRQSDSPSEQAVHIECTGIENTDTRIKLSISSTPSELNQIFANYGADNKSKRDTDEEEEVETPQVVFIDSMGEFSIQVASIPGIVFYATPARFAVSSDGTMYRVKKAGLEYSDYTGSIRVLTTDGMESTDTLQCEPIDMANVSDSDIDEVMATVEEDNERSAQASEIRSAIVAKREEARDASCELRARVDFQVLANEFIGILDSVSDLDFGDAREGLDAEETRYRYALVDMSGDLIPELLVRKDVRTAGDTTGVWHSYIRFASYAGRHEWR